MNHPHLDEVADGVFAYVQPDGGWMVNTMGLIGGPDGATSVDMTSTERRTVAYLEAAAGVAGPIHRVVYTHAHPDHCNGASLLPDAEIVAHVTAAEELRHPHPVAPHIFGPFDQGGVVPRIPTTTFEDSVVLQEGARRIVATHPPRPSHTRGDAYVWLPDQRVLFTGDLVFNGGTPFSISGSPSGWLTTLEELVALDPLVVVPGHGEPGALEILEPVARYLRFLIAVADDAHERHLTPLDAARSTDLGEFAGLLEPERIVGDLHGRLAELEGRVPDFAAAWEDMREFNGGPLEVHA
ncbi:MAG TPA: MBL fold metallo-hydrolase [Amnibacterium sp.]|uniref:MBL fold metallo-hydrolase n=1 Tax=Amnibacterium sp. TaxID=1872496 RepID=UPI002F951421